LSFPLCRWIQAPGDCRHRGIPSYWSLVVYCQYTLPGLWLLDSSLPLFRICIVFFSMKCKIMTPKDVAVQWIDSTFPESIHYCFNSSCSKVSLPKQFSKLAYCDYARKIIQQPRLNFLWIICF
jgi:hypothetical protein